MKAGDKVRFPEGNKFRFYMDHSVWECIPDDREFTILEIDDNFVELWADGYGGGIRGRSGEYGSGSIHVHKSSLIPVNSL